MVASATVLTGDPFHPSGSKPPQPRPPCLLLQMKFRQNTVVCVHSFTWCLWVVLHHNNKSE